MMCQKIMGDTQILVLLSSAPHVACPANQLHGQTCFVYGPMRTYINSIYSSDCGSFKAASRTSSRA